jgi:hypothetical protein
VTTSDGRPTEPSPEQLRDALLLGHRAPGPDAAARLIRQALAGRAARRQSARERTVRLWATVVAAALAVVVVGTLVAVRLGIAAQHRAGHVGQGSQVTPPRAEPPPAIVYRDPGDPTHLRQVGYDGLPLAGSWALEPTTGISGIVSVSPDGRYVILRDALQTLRVVDARGQVVTTVPTGIEGPEVGAWSADGSHLCRISVVGSDSLRLQLSIIDLSAPADPPKLSPVSGLRYPPFVSVVACDLAAGRAVLVGPVTDAVPAPPSAERAAVVVDLNTGTIVARASIGDASHGTVLSPDGRYLASIDYERGTSSIVSLATGKTVKVERGQVRGFSADDSRIVLNSKFDPPTGLAAAGATRILDWRSGRALYSQNGWTDIVRSWPGSADLALGVHWTTVTGEVGGSDLVIVPAVGARTLVPDVTIH